MVTHKNNTSMGELILVCLLSLVIQAQIPARESTRRLALAGANISGAFEVYRNCTESYIHRETQPPTKTALKPKAAFWIYTDTRDLRTRTSI